MNCSLLALLLLVVLLGTIKSSTLEKRQENVVVNDPKPLLTSSSSPSNDDWDNFKRKHGKQYNHDKESKRKSIFNEHLDRINKHNQDPNNKYKVAMNAFGDMTLDEIHQKYGLGKYKKQHNNSNTSIQKRVAAGSYYSNTGYQPSSIDWVSKGYVTGVKTQGYCLSCWAYSATGAIEAQYFKKTGRLVSLSEQNLVDCSRNNDNGGCDGGWPEAAFIYVLNNGGIATASSYPYSSNTFNNGISGSCKYSSSNKGAYITSYQRIKGGSEADLRNALGNVGPVSVLVDASDWGFAFYSSGIYAEPSCAKLMTDHAVLAVGYGNSNGQDYYRIKNQWGTDWGESGYIRIQRCANNACGIASNASFPLI